MAQQTESAKYPVTNPFKMREPSAAATAAAPLVHLIRPGVRCDTEKRGQPTPRGLSPNKIRVDATNGFIPLWAPGVTLNWRFQERSMRYFEDPEAAKSAIEDLLGAALEQWGDAAPVQFDRSDDVWDFEIVMSSSDDCDPNGCVLASAFFPDAGQHQLWMYPRMFTQSPKEVVDTFIHEIGHIFGLRHFFANVSETAWPSELFGTDAPFSIMNYGAQSELTDVDRSDLRRLYDAAWSGELTHINRTKIRLVQPFHAAGEPVSGPTDCTRAVGGAASRWQNGYPGGSRGGRGVGNLADPLAASGAYILVPYGDHRGPASRRG